MHIFNIYLLNTDKLKRKAFLVFSTIHFLCRMFKYVFVFCVFIISCKAKVKSQEPQPYQRPIYISHIRPLDLNEIDSYNESITKFMDSLLNNRGFSGGIMVVKNNQILYEHYQGFSDAAHKNPINDTTPFHVASTSKTFTSHAIFQLIEEGKLSLGDSITKFFPSLPYTNVTVKELLSHSSGIPYYVNFMDKSGWNKKQVATNTDMLNELIRLKLPLEFAPGTRFRYCNTNFALLALIVEKITGIPFPDYVKNNIFNKAGMTHSFIMSTSNMNRYLPSFHGNGIYSFDYLDAIYGDKNVYTTCTDLKRYDSAIRNRILLDSNSYALAWQPWYKDTQHRDPHEFYGLGWRLKVWPDGKKIVYHNGWWHGNNSCFQRLIMDTAVIIVTGNRFNSNIYKAGRAANIFRNYYDTDGNEEVEEGSAVDTANVKEPPIHERRVRHSVVRSRAKVVKATKVTKKSKLIKPTKQKVKAAKKRKH